MSFNDISSWTTGPISKIFNRIVPHNALYQNFAKRFRSTEQKGCQSSRYEISLNDIKGEWCMSRWFFWVPRAYDLAYRSMKCSKWAIGISQCPGRHIFQKIASKVNSYTAPPILTKIHRDYDHKRNLFHQDQNHFNGNGLSIVEEQRV